MKRTRLYRYIFGYDFFISYSRADCAGYALTLANLLFEKGYTVYIDQLGSEPDKKVPVSLLQTIKNASVMIVICSKGANTSEPIRTEIALFKTTKRSIIPISFDKINQSAIWYELIEGLAHTVDKSENLANEKVGDDVISRIINSLNYKRQRARVNRLITVLLLLLVLLPSVMIFETIKVDRLRDNIAIDNTILDTTRASARKLKLQNDSVSNRLKDNVKTLAMMDTALSKKGQQLKVTEVQGINVFKYANDLNAYINTLIGYIYGMGNYYQEPEFSIGFVQQNTPYRIFFQHDSSVLDDHSRDVLNQFAKLYLSNKDCQGVPLEIDGYVSSLGITTGDTTFKSKWGKLQYFTYPSELTLAHGLQFSKDVANSTKTALINAGIPARMIKAKAFSLGHTSDYNFISHADIKIFKPKPANTN